MYGCYGFDTVRIFLMWVSGTAARTASETSLAPEPATSRWVYIYGGAYILAKLLRRWEQLKGVLGDAFAVVLR